MDAEFLEFKLHEFHSFDVGLNFGYGVANAPIVSFLRRFVQEKRIAIKQLYSVVKTSSVTSLG